MTGRRWAVGLGQQRDAALKTDLGWSNSWRKNCPPSSDFLPKNIKLGGILNSAVTLNKE